MLTNAIRRVPIYACTIASKGIGRGINFIKSDLDAYLGPTRCHSYPSFLDLALTDRCNLKCRMCPRTYDSKIELSEMGLGDAKSIIDKMSPYVIRAQLAGGLGEPLLYENLHVAIDYVKDKKIDVFLTSNATLLDEEHARKLLKRKIDYISFSVDGATAETYEKIRLGAKFREVVDNIKRFCEMRDEMNNKVVVELVPVIMIKENLHEMPRLVELAHELGIDRVSFTDVHYSIDGKPITNQAVRMAKDPELMKKIGRIFGETKMIAKKLNVKLDLPSVQTHKVRGRCYQPWTMLTVTTKGYVRPCCGTHNIFFGNILQEEIEDIWNNEKFMDWRRRMRSDNPPPECLICPMFYEKATI